MTRSRLWWRPWRLAASNRRALAQLQRHGLQAPHARYFAALARSGTKTPTWLVDELIAAAARARAAGEEREPVRVAGGYSPFPLPALECRNCGRRESEHGVDPCFNPERAFARFVRWLRRRA